MPDSSIIRQSIALVSDGCLPALKARPARNLDRSAERLRGPPQLLSHSNAIVIFTDGSCRIRADTDLPFSGWGFGVYFPNGSVLEFHCPTPLALIF